MGQLHTISSIVSGSVAFFLNTNLAYIILITKSNNIGKYRLLLFLYTFLSAFYAINQILTTAVFVNIPGGYVVYDTLNILPYPLALFFVDNYTCCFIQIVATISWCFIYRYFVTLEASYLAWLHANGIKFFWGTTGTITLLLCGSLYGTFMREEYYLELGKDFFAQTGVDLRQTANNCGPVRVNGSLNWKILGGLGPYTFFIFLCAFVNIFCAVNVAFFLRRCFSESRTAAKRQGRIFTLLILQFIFPLVLNILPVFFGLLAAFIQIPNFGLGIFIGSSIAQIIDPILTVLFINDYKRTVIKLIAKRQFRIYTDVTPRASSTRE